MPLPRKSERNLPEPGINWLWVMLVVMVLSWWGGVAWLFHLAGWL